MVASADNMDSSDRLSTPPETPYQEEMCEKLIQISFAKIVNSKSERGGARLHKNLLILHLLQKARWEQRNRLLVASTPVDTTSRVNDYHQRASTGDDVSCENPGADVQNAEQMQTDRLTTDGDNDNVVEEEADGEEKIEIDETSGQQQDATRSTRRYERLTSPCLSSSAPPESGFDGNYRPGTRTTTAVSEESQKQASSRQTNESDTSGEFDFPFDVNAKLKTEGGESVVQEQLPATGLVRASPTTDDDRGGDNDDESRLRHQSNQRRYDDRHRRRRRSASAKVNRRVERNASSSSSSDDSDESSSSSEDNYCSRSGDKSNSTTMASGEITKSRDCLKRKLDDTCASAAAAAARTCQSSSPCDWYSSPKMACLVHGNAVVVESNAFQHQQHQNLNGLISVLQSAALTSADESTKTVSNGKRDQDDAQLTLNHFCDTEGADGSLPLTRSLSCPGLMELACES